MLRGKPTQSFASGSRGARGRGRGKMQITFVRAEKCGACLFTLTPLMFAFVGVVLAT